MAIKLTAPWDEYYNKLKAFFAQDEGVHILYDRDSFEIKVCVDVQAKADALEELLVKEITFGDVKLTISVMQPNLSGSFTRFNSKDELFRTAFDSNPSFSFARTVQLLYSNTMTFVVFVPEVLQYYNDNLGDWNGFRSTLYQDVAKEIFKEQDGVYYCTDKANALNAWM